MIHEHAGSCTVICCRVDPESLGDLNRNEYEAELYDAILKRWPGATINIGERTRTWGEMADGTEVTASEIQEVVWEVFNKMYSRSPWA